MQLRNFYPRGVSYARVLAIVVCLCVCLSHAGIVSKRLNVVFWRQQSLVSDPLPLEICAQSDPPTFRTPRFRPVSAHSASTMKDGEKGSVSTNRKLTTRFPTSHRPRWSEPCTLPLYVHQRVAQNAILLFLPVKFNFCRKKSATKFLCVKTSSGKFVATSLSYCERRPHQSKMCVQSDHPPLQKTPISTDFAL